MTIDIKIWYDFVHTKYGDEYLVLYIGRQRTYRKWFKILTIIFSASGVFSAFQSAKIPTIISFIAIGLVQVATSVENFIIHSEDDLDSLGRLRLLYYEQSNKLEELWHSLYTDKISIEDATTEFFKLRTSAKAIEELDNKLNVRPFSKLKKTANSNTNKYLNTYYNE
jgi:hypothetical protein